MNIAELAIKNRLLTLIVIVGSLLGGWFAYENMSRFEDPEFTIRTALVVTQYPGASPQEVASEVTESLETALQQLQEVEEISSVSSAGLSIINVDIKYEFSRTAEDLQGLWTKVRNKVADASGDLPPGAGEPSVNDEFGDVYGLYFAITGDGYSMREIEDYAKSLRTTLLAVDGVGKVTLSGVLDEAIYVEIARERLAALGISVNQVYSDLAQQNVVLFSGDVKVGSRRLAIRPTGLVDSVEAIENLEISTASGTIVYLRDIAAVKREYIDPPQLEVRYNGKPAVALGISNVTGANVVEMGEGIDEALNATLEHRPIGIEVHEFYHQGRIVERSVLDFALNVVLALAIVLVTLLIFMGLKSALIIGGVLVVTIAATLLVMYVADIPMHRISLGALIIALGMLVDNAIVVTEGILVAVQRGVSKVEAAKSIVARTKWPLLGGTVVGIIAFAPIGFAAGSTAEYTQHLFWVILISLLLSWLFALTVVPFFADLLYTESATGAISPKEGTFTRLYKAFMRGTLKMRWFVVVFFYLLFFGALWGTQYVKEGFFPPSTSPQIVVDYWLPEGTDASQTKKDVISIEPWLTALDSVEAVQSFIGAGGLRYMLVYNPEFPNTAYAQFLVKTDSFDSVGRLLPEIQSYLDKNYPDAQATAWRYQLGPGGGSKIEAEFSGPNPAVLRTLANQAKAIFAADDRATNIKDDWRHPVSVIAPQYSESRGRRLGISREDLGRALQTNFSGLPVGVYREGDRLLPIITRAPDSERFLVQQMLGIQIPSSITGGVVPLIEVVDGIDTIWQDAMLRRLDRQWTINAQADPVYGEVVSDLLNRVRPQVESIELPPGYSLTWDGELGASEEANESLAATLPLGVLALVLVVVLLFNALRQPLVIFSVVPLAVIGVIVGLVVTNTALEFMAILGVLSLSGLMIKNAIVLVDQMDLEIGEGKARFDAVVDSAASRVRPVLMGSLTTILGVLPLFGDAFFKSMAVVLVFGLGFATFVTLIVVPALYAIFFGIRSKETTN